MQVGTRILTKMLNYCSILSREIKKNWMSGACSTFREKRGAWLWWRGERDHLKDLDVDGRILISLFKNWYWESWN